PPEFTSNWRSGAQTSLRLRVCVDGAPAPAFPIAGRTRMLTCVSPPHDQQREKVDYEVYPPSLVVKMLETGNEVGTTGDHVSLGEEDSLRCLSEGVRLCLVGVKSRPELNCARGTAREYRAEADRWNVELASGELISLRPRCLSVLLAPSPPAEADAAPPPSPAAAHIGGEAAESAAAEASAEEERRPASPERRPPSPQPRAAAAGEQPPEPSPRPAAAAEGELPPRPPLGAGGSADAPGAAVSLRNAG
ncbi:unnamed protein product, partial [Prorocentrum cordatum]